MKLEQREDLDEAFDRLEALRGTLDLLNEAPSLVGSGQLAMTALMHLVDEAAACVDRVRMAEPTEAAA